MSEPHLIDLNQVLAYRIWFDGKWLVINPRDVEIVMPGPAAVAGHPAGQAEVGA